MAQKSIKAGQLDVTGIQTAIQTALSISTIGSVSSIAISGSTGLTVSGSPITTSGTITLTLGTELQGLSGLSTTGIVQRTGTGAYSVANLTSSQVTTALSYTPVNKTGDTLSGTLTFSSGTVTGLATPTNSTDAATKQYVDNVAAGLSWKQPAIAATTGNLTATYSGSPAFTLTNSSTQGAFATDGYTANVGDRILVKNQTTQSQNGIYQVTTVGSGTTNWVLTRTTDFDETTPINQINGAAVYVDKGTLYSNTGWVQVDNVTTLDTSSIAWAQFYGAGTGVSSATAGTGISVSSSTGAVTFTNTGVTSITGGSGISSSASTGGVTLSNTGVTSLAAGTGVAVSAATGGVTVSIGQAIGTGNTPTFAGINLSNRLQFANNIWNSTGDGITRLYFSTNADNYYMIGGGSHHFRNGGGADVVTIDSSGNLVANGDVTASSDQALKTDIENIKQALSKVLALNGVTFKRIGQDDDTRHVGLIAQDVEQVVPEAVGTNSDGYKTLAYGNLAGLFVEAMRELNTRIENIEKQLIGIR